MQIELDAQTEILTVDGVKISLDLLKSLANPDPHKVFHMTREGDVVTIQALSTVQLATEYSRRVKL